MKLYKSIFCCLFMTMSAAVFASQPDGRLKYGTYSADNELMSSDIATSTISNDTTYVYMVPAGEGEKSADDRTEQSALNLSHYLYDGKLWIPLRSNLSALSDELCRATADAESDVKIELTEISGNDFFIPLDVREDDKLSDASMTCRMRVGDDDGSTVDMPPMTITMKGEVLAPRRIVTPAGEYDCSVVRISVKVKMSIISMTEHMVFCFVPETGLVVREESVTRKGKVTEYIQIEGVVEP